MDYQLVLRFRGTTINNHKAMVELEDSLSEVLDDTEELDGHDFGLEGASLFILTSDAGVTFRRVKPLLERTGLLESITAGCGDIDDENYRVIWPESRSR